ncbi:hypothetical protein FRB94_012589 [Tulasnella sp. JGI-2019a]|nr:hypothetical protein FRB93_001448 [Tulasnella sp. JGI-2019a]KAG9009064.1 hypothetical protein FRB94_012589 [Tulasnella sp. JGI-2019a]KAG9030473.1 hypothetical protein FRB95_003923 [Tulasnella sp. JGI-2019a]
MSPASNADGPLPQQPYPHPPHQPIYTVVPPPPITAFKELIHDLTREFNNSQPNDALQFCSDWFHKRLAIQRGRLIDDFLKTNKEKRAREAAQGQINGTASPSSSAQQLKPAAQAVPIHQPFHPQMAANFNANRRVSAPASSPFGTLNVPGNVAFSTAATHRAPLPISINESEGFLGPPPSALGRRVSVSAESIEPSETGAEVVHPFYYKTPEQRQRLEDSIGDAFLFKNLDEKKRRAVLGAMKEMKFDAGTRVITQGDAGDYFYVVDSGELDCYVKPKADEQPLYPGAPPPPPPGPPGPEDHPEYGKKVVEYKKGTSFGELALMYSNPRAATIISKTPVTLWALDRVTFKTILLEISSRTRKDYEGFLRQVPILHSLTDRERAKLADVLQTRQFEYGEAVVSQGETGKEFYIVEEGEATVSKKVDGSTEEEIVMHLKRGDYFGELALLHRAPRAATVRSGNTSQPVDATKPKLKVAALDADAFTRLLGPLRELMERTAEQKYASTQ